MRVFCLEDGIGVLQNNRMLWIGGGIGGTVGMYGEYSVLFVAVCCL